MVMSEHTYRYNPDTSNNKESPEELYPGTTLNREDIVAEAAIKVSEHPISNKKPDVVIVAARVILRQVLTSKGIDEITIGNLKSQIDQDAQKILELLDKT